MRRAQTVGILRYFFCLAFFAFSLFQTGARAAGELPRAGAPRPLRLVASDGAPLRGLPRDVAWERRGGGLFFTLERDGTRNIWRAFPDPQDGSRFPAWRALPVTDLRAPRFAAQPTLLPGDRALVCVSNALAGAGATSAISQVVRYDFDSAKFRALSDRIVFYDSPQVSPDGKRVAFNGGSGAETRVYQALTETPLRRAMPAVTRVAQRARRPVWLDDQTLLVESLAPQARGLYWMPATSDETDDAASNAAASNVAASNVIVGGGGEASVLGDNGVVFSAKTSAQSPTNLYLVARDGSGLRALSETAGARRPAVAPDGQTLAYDAPQNGQGALWVVPLLRVENRVAARPSVGRFWLCADGAPDYEGPSVGLKSVRPTEGGVAIIGSLRGTTNANLTLEVGQGGKPKRWGNLSVLGTADAPPADAEGNRVLAIWNPPARARGDWTLRLSLRGLGGGAQSLLRVRLPLPPLPLPPIPQAPPGARPNALSNGGDATEARTPATSPLPRATPLPELPDVMPVRDPFLALPPVSSVVPVPADQGDDLPGFPAIQSPLPLPDVVAPPPNQPAQTSAPLAQAPATAGFEIVPIDPARLPRVPVNAPPSVTPPVTSPVTPPIVARDDDSGYGERPNAPANAPLVAQFDIAGTPARMKPREKVTVTFRGINRGTATWQTGASGADRVRLVARWVDFSTGTRRQWNFFWLPEPVAPGERTDWKFDVLAPARAGKYKLIYGLVRLPANGEYQAPPYSASQENWDGEFGAIAFAVEIAPN